MRTTAGGWQVIDDDACILVHPYRFDGEATANCFIARMANGQLLVISPGCNMPEAAIREIGRYGQVGALLANNGIHWKGLAEWKARFPRARVFASADAAHRIRKQTPNAPRFEPLAGLTPLLGDTIIVTEMPASRIGETWTVVRRRQGAVWFASDLLTNMPRLAGPMFMRWLFRLTGSGPGFRVFHLALLMTARDRSRMLSQLLAGLTRYPPAVIVPAHGDVLHGPRVMDTARGLVMKALR